jgi:hypothetical protein
MNKKIFKEILIQILTVIPIQIISNFGGKALYTWTDFIILVSGITAIFVMYQIMVKIGRTTLLIRLLYLFAILLAVTILLLTSFNLDIAQFITRLIFVIAYSILTVKIAQNYYCKQRKENSKWKS